MGAFDDLIPSSATANKTTMFDDLIPDQHNEKWHQSQSDMIERSLSAGLPATTDARQRLTDAIGRTEAAGYPTEHFIGTQNEPTGDRGVTRDLEHLVTSLQKRAQKDSSVLPELNYWKQEAANGMTAQQWKDQTGDPEPLYPSEHTPDYSGEGQIQNTIANYVPPEWATKAAKSVAKNVSENVPHSWSDVPGFVSPLFGVGNELDEAKKNYAIIQDVAGGMSVEDATRKNAPERFELKDALQKPWGDQSQYDVAGKLLLAGGMVAAPFLHGKLGAASEAARKTGMTDQMTADAARSASRSARLSPEATGDIQIPVSDEQKLRGDRSQSIGAQGEEIQTPRPEITPLAPKANDKTDLGIKEPQSESVKAQGQNTRFVPSTDWQEIPEGTVLPNGGEYRFDQSTGKNYARWSPENVNEAKASSPAGVRGVAAEEAGSPVLGPRDEQTPLATEQKARQGASATDYRNRPISIDEEPRTTGISQRMHEQAGSGIEPGTGIGPEEAVNLGRSDLVAGADPEAIVAKIDAGQAITGRETGVLRAHVENLAKASAQAQDAADLRPTNPVLRKAAQTAFDAETDFRQRIKPAATEWQRVGATMQGETDIDTGSFTALRRAVQEQRGSDIKPHEAPRLRQASERVQRATQAEGIARERLAKATDGLKTKLPVDKDGLASHLAEKFRKMTPCEV